MLIHLVFFRLLQVRSLIENMGRNIKNKKLIWLICIFIFVSAVMLCIFSLLPQNIESGVKMGERNNLTEKWEDIVDFEYDYKSVVLFPAYQEAELVVKGKYVSVKEFDDDGSGYYIYEIETDKVLKDDADDVNVIQIIGIKKDFYKFMAYESRRFQDITPAFFRQLSLGDEVLLFLRKAYPNGIEENYYESISYVYYINDMGNIYELLLPESLGLLSDKPYKERWTNVRVNIDDMLYVE